MKISLKQVLKNDKKIVQTNGAIIRSRDNGISIREPNRYIFKWNIQKYMILADAVNGKMILQKKVKLILKLKIKF